MAQYYLDFQKSPSSKFKWRRTSCALSTKKLAPLTRTLVRSTCGKSKYYLEVGFS